MSRFKIKSAYINHIIIWCVLIIFKALVDYNFWGKISFNENLNIFGIAILMFYINYWLFMPFLIRQKKQVIIFLVLLLISGYVAFYVITAPIILSVPMVTMPAELQGESLKLEADTTKFQKTTTSEIKYRSLKPDNDSSALALKIRNAPSVSALVPGEINGKAVMQHNAPTAETIDLPTSDIILKIGVFALVFSTILFLMDKWLDNEKRIKSLEYERQANELKALREQINPHFFFNALNSIYSLSITKSEDTSRVIQLLSDIMRYVFNNSASHGKKNNLLSEVDNIRKYIDIQSLRFKKYNNIHATFSGDFFAYEIEPLLLLTFVENAFKYANIQEGPIEISLVLNGDVLEFGASNYYEKDSNFISSKVGIKNTKQKLNLLYPKKYELEIKDDGAKYEIYLSLNLL